MSLRWSCLLWRPQRGQISLKRKGQSFLHDPSGVKQFLVDIKKALHRSAFFRVAEGEGFEPSVAS